MITEFVASDFTPRRPTGASTSVSEPGCVLFFHTEWRISMPRNARFLGMKENRQLIINM